MSDIFISHVEEDEGLALEIAHALEGAGFSTWYYERDSVPGVSYLEQIDEAIQQARAVVVLISLDSMSSWQVDKEVERAHECGKNFVPVLRGIKHVEFQNRKRGWRMAMGATTSILIPPEGISGIIPRVILGLKQRGITPEDSSRVEDVADASSGKTQKVERAPEDAAVKACLAAGDEHFERGEHKQAIERYAEAIRLDPKFALAFSKRGMAALSKCKQDWALTAQRGLDFDEKRPLNEAIADFTEAIRLDSGLVEAFNGRGLCYLAKREFQNAISDFDEVIRVRPTYAMAYCNRGDAHYNSGEYSRAKSYFTEAIRIDPTCVEAYENRARLNRLDKKFDLVVADCTEGIKVRPDNALLYWRRASAYTSLGEYDRAIADYTEARRLDSTFVGDVGRPDAYLAKKEYDLAIADYTDVISYSVEYLRANPGSRLAVPPVAYMNRGLARFEKGEYDLAIVDFTEAIKGHEAYPEAYEKRGDAHAAKGEQASATADRDKAREIRSRRGY